MRLLVLPFLLLALALPALAVDGVLEINQTCAVTSGCFPTDLMGYPVFIDQPGSYRLTSNLVVPDENTDGIQVAASSVSIDLNGFEITRLGCEGATNSCTPNSGTGTGVLDVTGAASSPPFGSSVKNGTITGMGLAGVLLGDRAKVTNLQARWNRTQGIECGTGSMVSRNTAYRNGSVGILVGDDSVVSGNAANGNINHGIQTGDNAVVEHNAAGRNFRNGIQTDNYALVGHNTANENSFGGVRTGAGSVVSGNTANGTAAGVGIFMDVGGLAERNIISANVLGGLVLKPTTGYRGNVVTNNGGAPVSSGVDLGENFCDGPNTPACHP